MKEPVLQFRTPLNQQQVASDVAKSKRLASLDSPRCTQRHSAARVEGNLGVRRASVVHGAEQHVERSGPQRLSTGPGAGHLDAHSVEREAAGQEVDGGRGEQLRRHLRAAHGRQDSTSEGLGGRELGGHGLGSGAVQENPRPIRRPNQPLKGPPRDLHRLRRRQAQRAPRLGSGGRDLRQAAAKGLQPHAALRRPPHLPAAPAPEQPGRQEGQQLPPAALLAVGAVGRGEQILVSCCLHGRHQPGPLMQRPGPLLRDTPAHAARSIGARAGPGAG
mmetsp:Transcript_146526/g.470056  ORF Transcript_146526/g.470056 Transcript_146526/m.470056 type:complete len:275 (-) Transcript_146526:416-1240(-)